MKILEVPLYQQEPGSVDCGPVCSRMMLEFFGVKRTLEELRQHCKYSEEGTSAFDNGRIFLSEGFRVEAVTAHPLLFPPDVVPKLKSSAVIVNRLKGLSGRVPERASGFAMFQSYLEAGGDVTMEIPSMKHIKAAIDSGSPVLALTYAKALGTNEGGFHFVIVSGYKRGYVHITNPSPRATPKGWFPVDRFLFALHASTCVDIDNGTLIIPRSRA